MHTMSSLSSLPDDSLLREAGRLVRVDRHATAALVRVLIEVDARRLYFREGCSSIFIWCVRVLGLEEGAAYNRIEVARLARRLPAVLEALERGFVSLTALRLLSPHLTAANHAEVLERATGLRKREVQRLVVELAPRPAVPSTIRRVTSVATRRVGDEGPAAQSESAADAPAPTDRSAAVPASASAPVLEPLSATQYKLQVTIREETQEKLRLAQDLLRHTVPDGDLAEVLDRALTVLVRQLERQRFAATATPRPSRASSSTSRYIPAFVRRAVWQRDGGQCAFVGRQGRCSERAWLEFHHATPYAVGGAATVDNISLRCRAHNAFEASIFAGAVATTPTNGAVAGDSGDCSGPSPPG